MINIRKIESKDREPVYEILQQTDMFSPAEIDVAMELIDTVLFNKDQKDYLIYVGESKANEVVGYVCYGPTPATEGTFDLYWIAVSPAFQGKGAGKELLHFIESEVKNKNGRLIIIETSSQSKYLPTREFYLRNKYKIAAQIKDFYRMGDDRVIFVNYFH
ncbi:MAG: GNAT family N-acetyltransferase [Calditrichaceae bacterium]